MLGLSEVRGFNYSGSWGTSALDLWQHHDHGTMAVEVARGKHYFPGWNAARWWLSNEAFQRNRERFLANFDAGLAIFAAHGIKVMPVLFNRWRDPTCDFGGVSLDHLLPGFAEFEPSKRFSEGPDPTKPGSIETIFGDYIGQVIGPHRADDRIIAWDLCNEPFIGPYLFETDSVLRRAELDWLNWCYRVGKTLNPMQPLTVGSWWHVAAIEIVEPISDIISIHPYFIPGADGSNPLLQTKSAFEAMLDQVVAYAAVRGKELLATETVWGALIDSDRVAILRYTLGELHKRQIGFMAHALHHSLVADLHAPEFGPVGWPGRLEFINADGSLRAGHEAFNEFAASPMTVSGASEATVTSDLPRGNPTRQVPEK